MAAILEYLMSFRRHWVAIVTGSLPLGVYTFLVLAYPDAGTAHYLWNHLSQWVVWALAILALVIAQYMAWLDLRSDRDAIKRRLREQLRFNIQVATAADFDLRFGQHSNLSPVKRLELVTAHFEKLEAEIAGGNYSNAGEVLILKEPMIEILRAYFGGGVGYPIWHKRLFTLVDAVKRHERGEVP